MKIDSFVKDNSWSSQGIPAHIGWGNGYVKIPPDHPCYRMHYDYIYIKYGSFVEHIHELTYSDFWREEENPENYWVVGFDTIRYMDNLGNWPEERVRQEADRLAFAMLEIWIFEERKKIDYAKGVDE